MDINSIGDGLIIDRQQVLATNNLYPEHANQQHKEQIAQKPPTFADEITRYVESVDGKERPNIASSTQNTTPNDNRFYRTMRDTDTKKATLQTRVADSYSSEFSEELSLQKHHIDIRI